MGFANRSKKSGSPLRLGVTRAVQTSDYPAISRVLGGSSDVGGCTQLERLLPCPFRRPSMAGGRRPLAATPLRHKHGETSAREDDRKPAAQENKPGARTHAAIGPLAGCLDPRCQTVATTAGLWGEGPPSQGPDSPPNDEESPFSSMGKSSATVDTRPLWKQPPGGDSAGDPIAGVSSETPPATAFGRAGVNRRRWRL